MATSFTAFASTATTTTLPKEKLTKNSGSLSTLNDWKRLTFSDKGGSGFSVIAMRTASVSNVVDGAGSAFVNSPALLPTISAGGFNSLTLALRNVTAVVLLSGVIRNIGFRYKFSDSHVVLDWLISVTVDVTP
uniref:Uncharacterized protein n=1 Tax=Glossina pallidipes TaxID=7398 RepID=A0A1A9ZS16_GLOPL